MGAVFAQLLECQRDISALVRQLYQKRYFAKFRQVARELRARKGFGVQLQQRTALKTVLRFWSQWRLSHFGARTMRCIAAPYHRLRSVKTVFRALKRYARMMAAAKQFARRRLLKVGLQHLTYRSLSLQEQRITSFTARSRSKMLRSCF